MMSCFDFTRACLECGFGGFLDFLVEFLDGFLHSVVTACIVFSFLFSTCNLDDLLGGFCNSFVTLFLFFLDKNSFDLLFNNFLCTDNFLVGDCDFLEFVNFQDKFVDFCDGFTAMLFDLLSAFLI